MICPICKKPTEHPIKVFYKEKGARDSEQKEICIDCEGEMERPFVVYIQSKLARAFIRSVKSKGEYVKDTMVKMMKDFVKEE